MMLVSWMIFLFSDSTSIIDLGLNFAVTHGDRDTARTTAHAWGIESSNEHQLRTQVFWR